MKCAIRTVDFLLVLHDQKWIVVKITEELYVRPAEVSTPEKPQSVAKENVLHPPIVFIVLEQFVPVEELPGHAH